VDAVCSIDFQFWGAFVGDHFIDCRGTKILARIAELPDAAVTADIRFKDDQMARLILVMARTGMIDIGQSVKRQLPVALVSRGLVDERPVAVEIFVILVARLGSHRIDQPASSGDELQSRVE